MEGPADLEVPKTESVERARAGTGPGNLVHVVTVRNSGPSDASGIVLYDVLALPAGVSVDSATPNTGVFVPPIWTIGDLASGASETLTVVLTVDASAAEGTDVVGDSAWVAAVNEFILAPWNDSAKESTTIERWIDLPELETVVTGWPDPFCPGWDPSYILVITNTGPITLTNTTVSDQAPEGACCPADGASSVPGAITGPDLMTWDVGDLGIGETIQIGVSLNSLSTLHTGQVVTNTFVISGTELSEVGYAEYALAADTAECGSAPTPTPTQTATPTATNTPTATPTEPARPPMFLPLVFKDASS